VRENRLKTMWKRGETAVNGWLFDSHRVHGRIWRTRLRLADRRHAARSGGLQTAVSMFQGIYTTGVMPLARVPWNDPAYLMKILDAGAYGVICPISTRARQAEALVAACSTRHAATIVWTRARLDLRRQRLRRARNDDIVIMPMIETASAQELDAILSTPGVDAVYVGPSDLSLALGCKPRLDADRRAGGAGAAADSRRCKRHGIIAASNATAAYSLKMMAAAIASSRSPATRATSR